MNIWYWNLVIKLCILGAVNSQAQDHFINVWSSPYLPMNIYISSAEIIGIGNLVAGDEIAAFDGSICVGSVMLNGTINPSLPIQIIASMDDPTTQPIEGFIQGHTISFKFWRSTNMTEIQDVEATYILGSGVFTAQGTTLVSLSASVTVGTNVVNDNRRSYFLSQNFPNPFNPTTKIIYQLSKESKVVLTIYNLLGSEVMELINEQKEPGIYEVEFKASELSSGTYIYKISADNFVQTKKMILIK